MRPSALEPRLRPRRGTPIQRIGQPAKRVDGRPPLRIREQITVTSELRHRLKHPPTRRWRCCDTRDALRQVVLLHGHDRPNELDRHHSPGRRAALLIRSPPASLGAPLRRPAGAALREGVAASGALARWDLSDTALGIAHASTSNVSYRRMDGRGPSEPPEQEQPAGHVRPADASTDSYGRNARPLVHEVCRLVRRLSSGGAARAETQCEAGSASWVGASWWVWRSARRRGGYVARANGHRGRSGGKASPLSWRSAFPPVVWLLLPDDGRGNLHLQVVAELPSSLAAREYWKRTRSTSVASSSPARKRSTTSPTRPINSRNCAS